MRLTHISCVVALMLLASTASATIFGSVRGIVHDPQHRPIQGTMVMINSGGAAGSGSGSSPDSAQDPTQANPTEPTVADDSKSGQKSAR